MSISENERYWQHRAQRAEALLRRARPILAGQQRVSWQIVDDMDAALATPPPEGGSESWAGTWDEQADVPLCDWKPGMRNTPEQADSYPLDSEGRCLKCGGTGRIGVDSTREPCPACTSTASQQAHGDALAALDTLVDAATDESGWLWPDVAEHEAGKIRRHLTASGVPGHWACKNPGRADQYRAEAMACRRALGFDAESHDVSPTDLTSAIADSGVPYVPEEVRRFPDLMRRLVREQKMSNETRDYIDALSHRLDAALASAPAVLNRREIFYRLANYESDEPYEGGEDQPQFSYSRYVLDQWLVQDHRGDCTNEPFTCMRCFAERCWYKAGWIAAAPTDGREHD